LFAQSFSSLVLLLFAAERYDSCQQVYDKDALYINNDDNNNIIIISSKSSLLIPLENNLVGE
jgi:hypothetical protein